MIKHFWSHKFFVLMLPFEMRTVLYRIHLFNDVRHKHVSTIYMKQKEGGREQYSGETKRERVQERWQREKVASVVKMTIEENRPFGIRIGLF
jgi:hypothetical protein